MPTAGRVFALVPEFLYEQTDVDFDMCVTSCQNGREKYSCAADVVER
jgi:hypothetical protein